MADQVRLPSSRLIELDVELYLGNFSVLFFSFGISVTRSALLTALFPD